ncbi:uncharacterized protein UV8b_08015 [Ustilaginoidea virens]|uniref:Uncharacterized protein n=1 Tax=Ustilaginoidea virens TaxID=1159556 RepID=A0A8E5HYY3_USTVR|nr:uncharacterized protein UV8b_08015 [Ustilaginoidea virens]QUC23774.1 hypothetical protein UV8b_08015 [Ustilaginoidea virens]
MPRRLLQRPSISAPFGPVVNSRGPDLVRSQEFELVGCIADCVSGSAAPSVSAASSRSRRISAGFVSEHAPSASPTIAESELSAITLVGSTKSSKGSLGKRSALFSLSAKSLLKQPSRYTLIATKPQPHGSKEDRENVAPIAPTGPGIGGTVTSNGAGSTAAGRIPRSKTLTVWQGLSKSFSRTSLAGGAKAAATEVASTPKSLPAPRKPGKMEASIPKPCRPASSSTTICQSHDAPSPPAVRLHRNTIDAPQTSEYWTGRFTALNDRILSEKLAERPLVSSPWDTNPWQQSSTPGRDYASLASSTKRSTYLPPSNTTPALSTVTCSSRKLPSDCEDDLRCQRIFGQLNSLCTTSEAKQSLWTWQQAYARRLGKPRLLPQDGTMSDKARTSRVLTGMGGRFKSSERRGTVLNELPSPRGGSLATNLGSLRDVAVC